MVIAACALLLCLSARPVVLAQSSGQPLPDQDRDQIHNQAPPRSDSDAQAPDPHFPSGETSSSKDTNVDISPPRDDAAKHPYSRAATDDEDGDANAGSDVQEFHVWDPHRALKDIEVGDFYLKRKNYRAAEDRYREALVYKPGDAIAQLRLGETLEKLGEIEEARQNYEGYLKILPDGPLAKEAHEGLARLNKAETTDK